MFNETAIKPSLKEMLTNIKINKEEKYLNFEVNIMRLGNFVYNQKTPKNLFDVNKISKENRFTPNIQARYTEELLKASTYNYKIDQKTFTFNSEERITWILLEFDKKTDLSDEDNIKYFNEFIIHEINIMPTLITVQDDIVLVGYFFPNSPTSTDKLKKYKYFIDIRTALTHTLEAKWKVTDKYNQLKEYKNILDYPYLLTGTIHELGIFQELLDDYKTTSTFKQIIHIKQSHGGQQSGLLRKQMSLEDKKTLLKAANKKKVLISYKKIKKVIKKIQSTQENPKYSIYNIVKTSKQMKKSLSERTVAKYLHQIKIDLNLE